MVQLNVGKGVSGADLGNYTGGGVVLHILLSGQNILCVIGV